LTKRTPSTQRSNWICVCALTKTRSRTPARSARIRRAGVAGVTQHALGVAANEDRAPGERVTEAESDRPHLFGQRPPREVAQEDHQVRCRRDHLRRDRFQRGRVPVHVREDGDTTDSVVFDLTSSHATNVSKPNEAGHCFVLTRKRFSDCLVRPPAPSVRMQPRLPSTCSGQRQRFHAAKLNGVSRGATYSFVDEIPLCWRTIRLAANLSLDRPHARQHPRLTVAQRWSDSSCH
jgi:hypothetical protein